MTTSSIRLRDPFHDLVRGQTEWQQPCRPASPGLPLQTGDGPRQAVALVTNNDEAAMPNCMTSTARMLTQKPLLTARQPIDTLAALLQHVLNLTLRRAARRNPSRHNAQAGDALPEFVDTDWTWKEVPPPR